uniref:Uncharacterized protein n=1 Tax=Oryza punctata TaxID=4537 RepID=A0A0E0M8V2_ORYPU
MMDPASRKQSSSGGSVGRLRASPPSIPKLKYACGVSAMAQTSNTARNPRRRWLQCGKSEGSSFLWIWEDLLNEYAEEMVAYWHAGEYEYMRETIDMLRQFLADEKIDKGKMCELLDAKQNELKSTIEALNQCRLECLAMKKHLEQVKLSRCRLLYVLLVLSFLVVTLVLRTN